MPSALVEGLLLLPQPPSESSRRSPTKAAASQKRPIEAEMAAAKAEDDRSEAG